MSTDGSRELATQFGATIFDVPEGTFDHGLTRNAGVKRASGELIFLTVQDAWPASDDILEKMAAHFADPDVMAVTGHQAIPHEKNMNPILWFRPVSTPKITEKAIAGKEAFLRLSPMEQQALISWDDVVAMYRKEALTAQPFIATEFAEDWLWSCNALLKGWKLLHDSSLIMYHYHHQSYGYAFRSRYTISYHLYKFFKFRPALPMVLLPVIRATFQLVKNKKLSWREKSYWIMHNTSAILANFLSTLNFLTRLKTDGEEGIQKGYSKYCKSIPQGRLKD